MSGPSLFDQARARVQSVVARQPRCTFAAMRRQGASRPPECLISVSLQKGSGAQQSRG